MPEATEVYLMRISVMLGIMHMTPASLVVAETNHPKRVFVDRTMDDAKVEAMRPNLEKVQGYTLVSCLSQNKEIALFFKNANKFFFVYLKLALGAVLFWATLEDLDTEPLNLKAQPHTRTNFYIRFTNTNKILVLMDCNQYKNMATWEINTNFFTYKPLWSINAPDVFGDRNGFIWYMLQVYNKHKHGQMYLFQFFSIKEFSSVFGQYTKAELLGRAYIKYNFGYFDTVETIIQKENGKGLILLCYILFEFLDNMMFWYQFYNPLIHNFSANKNFNMNFLIAYRKPNAIKIEKGNKISVYALCTPVDVPQGVTIKKSKKLTKNELAVGPNAWHSKSNFPKIKVILPDSGSVKKRSRPHNRLSKAQRLKRKVANGKLFTPQ
jgi:hypothetical protein